MKPILLASLAIAVTARPSFSDYVVQDAFPLLPTFTLPTDLRDPHDGTDRLFVVEKQGTIRVFDNDPGASTAGMFLSIVDSVTNVWESGLIGLTFHPDYENNGYFYVVYVSKEPVRTIVSRFSVSGNPNVADPNSELRLIEAPQLNLYHKGGGLAFGPDAYLYISLGEDGEIYDSQSLTSLKGKLLRIDVDATSGGLNYAIPTDNPFAGNLQGWREEIWAFGFRNPWRFSFDPNGWLWLGDVGLDTWEEIDIVKKGRNYGWPRLEGTMCAYPPVCDTTGLNIDMPLWVYPHTSPYGAAVVGGFVYQGTHLPSLYGRYIYSDHSGGEVWALNYDGVNPPSNYLLYTPPDAAYFRIDSFCEDKDQEIFMLSYIVGRIYQLVEPTAVGETPSAAGPLAAYPNPFSGETRIRYAARAGATLDVHDVKGRRVRRVLERAHAGGEARWDGRDDAGRAVPSGVYFARLAIEGRTMATHRIVRLK